MFFEGDTIYSYGKHFPMAKFEEIEYQNDKGETVSDNVVLYTTRGYSVSTAKHLAYTRRAIPRFYRVVYVYSPTASVEQNLWHEHGLVTHYLEQYGATNHHGRKQKLARELSHVITRITDICDAYHIPVPEWAQLSDDLTEAARQANERKQAAEAAARAKREKEEAAAKRKARAYLKDWIKDTTMATSGWNVPSLCNHPTCLRVTGEEIETSHGARVPVEHAVKIWPLLRSMKAKRTTYKRNGHTIHLGHYAVESFDGKELVVGCHHIPWAELARIAEELGLEEGK